MEKRFVSYVIEFVIYFVIVTVVELVFSKIGLVEEFSLGTCLALSLGWIIGKAIVILIEKKKK